MNVARLNFSHGNFEQHAEVIERIRNVSKAAGRRVAIMEDLPGPKMGLGTIRPDLIQVVSGDTFTLTRGHPRICSKSYACILDSAWQTEYVRW